MEKKISGLAPNEAWFILTNLKSLDLAIAAYKRRFNIEKCLEILKHVAII